ncbi:MAG TPA: hypothetical protein PL045_08850 [Chitinophagaceae bacterium]|nr:hypothetical protein [Chitinophagaceae bacterium]
MKLFNQHLEIHKRSAKIIGREVKEEGKFFGAGLLILWASPVASHTFTVELCGAGYSAAE